MTPKAQRIAIAEACGWTSVEFRGSTLYRHPGWKEGAAKTIADFIPDYLNDLNAMHEAEQILWRMDWNHRHIFNDHLANTIRGRTVNRNEWDAETLLDATAAQRAEAFLKTLNLWKP